MRDLQTAYSIGERRAYHACVSIVCRSATAHGGMDAQTELRVWFANRARYGSRQLHVLLHIDC